MKIIESLNTYQAAIAKNPDLELIPLDSLLPGIKTDFVYAGTHNFTGQVLYQAPRAYLRKPAALALQKVARTIQKLGYGLLIYDAYRPYSVTVKMWEVVPDNRYAADPRHGSGHNRGLSVDLSLYDLKTGKPLEMPTGFDDFTNKAHQDYMDLPHKVLENRSLLKRIMRAAGFKPLSTEWWHFSYPGANNEYHLMDISFAALNHPS